MRSGYGFVNDGYGQADPEAGYEIADLCQKYAYWSDGRGTAGMLLSDWHAGNATIN